MILVVVIIAFGPSQIPKLSRLLGKGVKNLRKSVNEVEEEVEESGYD